MNKWPKIRQVECTSLYRAKQRATRCTRIVVSPYLTVSQVDRESTGVESFSSRLYSVEDHDRLIAVPRGDSDHRLVTGLPAAGEAARASVPASGETLMADRNGEGSLEDSRNEV